MPSSISVTLRPHGSSWLPGCYPGSPSPLRRDLTVSILRCLHRKISTGETHSPCSQLHARLAGCIAETAGGLLPHPFTPYRPRKGGGYTFCCGCSQLPVTGQPPPLTVSWGNLSSPRTGWKSGSSSEDRSINSDGDPLPSRIGQPMAAHHNLSKTNLICDSQ